MRKKYSLKSLRANAAKARHHVLCRKEETII